MGDGSILGLEVCDDGSDDGIGCALGGLGPAEGFTCNSTSTSVCENIYGDGITVFGEECDDGNKQDNDGC